MTKPNQKVKDEFEQKFIDSSTRVGNGRNRRWSITFVQEIQGGIQSRNAVTNDIWQLIDSALTKQREELKEMVEGSRKYRFVGQGRDNFIKEKDVLEKL